MLQVKRVLQGSASNLIRVLLSALIGFVLPPFLVSRMPPAEYSAWVLILQLSAYVNLMDLGLQTAIGKFVAEYDSLDDRLASGRILSNSFAILSAAGIVGIAVISVLSWQVPRLFHEMPAALVRDVRLSLLIVGVSVAITLPFNVFLAAFIGLQRYRFPTALLTVNKIVTSAALVGALLMHAGLLQLAGIMAGCNIATGLLQFLGWWRYAKSRVDFSIRLFHRESALLLIKYGSVLSVWTIAGLLISGLDTVIVGHFDYANTGYYAIASSITNFMLLIVGSMFGPLLPAISSLQSSGNSEQIGNITVKATRYCALALCLIGLPIFFGAYPLLSLWVGNNYAKHSSPFLEILILGNIVRMLAYPYAVVVVGTGKQHLATIAGLAEAMVNIGLSIWLVQRMGALGVAIGTLVGAFVSIGVHLSVSMRFTKSTILIQRRRFALDGLLRPLLCVVPSLVLLPIWRSSEMLPSSPLAVAMWAVATLAIACFGGLTAEDRRTFRGSFRRLAYRRGAQV